MSRRAAVCRTGPVACLLLLASCAGYWSDRLRDLDESLLFDVQAGYGLGVDARALFLDLGAGLGSSAVAWGKPTWWEPVQTFRERHMSSPVPMVFDPWYQVADEDFIEVLTIPFTHKVVRGTEEMVYTRVSHLLLTLPTWEIEEAARDGELSSLRTIGSDRRNLDVGGIEGGFFLGGVGARVGFNVVEFVDFLAGWFGIDVVGDDG